MAKDGPSARRPGPLLRYAPFRTTRCGARVVSESVSQVLCGEVAEEDSETDGDEDEAAEDFDLALHKPDEAFADILARPPPGS